MKQNQFFALIAIASSSAILAQVPQPSASAPIQTILSGDPTARAALRVVPNLTDAAKFKSFAPSVYAALVANPNPSISQVTVAANAATVRPHAQASPVIAPATQNGKPSQVGTVTTTYWQVDRAGTEVLSGQPSNASFSFGSPGDKFFVGDWNGSGTSKPGVYSNGTWYLDTDGDNLYDRVFDLGTGNGSNLLPVIGDWTGDGKTKVGVFNTSTQQWTLDLSGTGTNRTTFIFAQQDPSFILTPVVGDWSGDGKTKVGWYYRGFWAIDYNGNQSWDGVDGGDRFAGFGGNGYSSDGTSDGLETPLVGDWTGQGQSQIGVNYKGFWILDLNGSYAWEDTSVDGFGGIGGNAGESPVIGDWNGNGRIKVGFFYNGHFYLDYNGDIIWNSPDRDVSWTSGGMPVIGYWVPTSSSPGPPTITGISRTDFPVQTGYQTTIKGTGFGTSPTLTIGGGANIYLVSASSTEIVASVVVPSTAMSGIYPITVLAFQQSASTNVKFQVPTSVSVVSQGVTTQPPGACIDTQGHQVPYSFWTYVKYQVLDQTGSAIKTNGYYVQESIRDDYTNGTGPDNSQAFWSYFDYPAYSGSKPNTDMNGQFLDIPLGGCTSVSISANAEQLFRVGFSPNGRGVQWEIRDHRIYTMVDGLNQGRFFNGPPYDLNVHKP